MESDEDWIPGGCYRTQWNRNTKGKSEQSTKLARAKEHKRCQKIFGPCKLLQKVYQRFFSGSKTNEYTDQKGYKVTMGKRATAGI